MMKTTSTFPLIILLIALFSFQACATSSTSSSDERETSDRSEEKELVSDVKINPNGTLEDHLRRIPGLEIYDTYVQVRGPKSIHRSGREGALFVVNSVPMGENFSRVKSLIYMENVTSINVYTGGDAFRRYGSSAAYGLIEITTH